MVALGVVVFGIFDIVFASELVKYIDFPDNSFEIGLVALLIIILIQFLWVLINYKMESKLHDSQHRISFVTISAIVWVILTASLVVLLSDEYRNRNAVPVRIVP